MPDKKQETRSMSPMVQMLYGTMIGTFSGLLMRPATVHNDCVAATGDPGAFKKIIQQKGFFSSLKPFGPTAAREIAKFAFRGGLINAGKEHQTHPLIIAPLGLAFDVATLTPLEHSATRNRLTSPNSTVFNFAKQLSSTKGLARAVQFTYTGSAAVAVKYAPIWIAWGTCQTYFNQNKNLNDTEKFCILTETLLICNIALCGYGDQMRSTIQNPNTSANNQSLWHAYKTVSNVNGGFKGVLKTTGWARLCIAAVGALAQALITHPPSCLLSSASSDPADHNRDSGPPRV